MINKAEFPGVKPLFWQKFKQNLIILGLGDRKKSDTSPFLLGRLYSKLSIVATGHWETINGIFIPKCSDMAVSSTVSACGVDKPLKSHLETTVKQEVNPKMIGVQLSLDLGSFG